ncbi:MAG: FAD-binding oxidoreductase [Thermoleophilaceae bacterium]
MTDQAVVSAAAQELATGFAGELIQPDDAAYDEARAVWNGMFDRRPALIARCSSVADVQAAVSFARDNDLTVAVRGGGHSASGHGTCDDGVVIDLAGMKAIDVDPVAQTARAEGGVTWGEFDAATQEHNLAVTGGRFSTTGIAGLTLGSGSGWLERKCGLTADNLLSVDMVTADGAAISVSADENPELFWGIRGGGGNFGVVTSFTYRLHDVGPLVYGGLMAAPPERAAETLRFLREWFEDAPEDLGGAMALMSAPPEPFVPQEMHFQPAVGMVICWTGDLEEGERVVAPLREVMQPAVDMVQPMPYAALQSMLDAGGPKGINAYMKAEFMTELDDDAIEKLVSHGNARPGPMTQLLIEPMGGAIGHVSEHETALGRRDVKWCFHALAMWMDDDQDTADAHVAWARELAEDMGPHTTDGVYLNFTSDEGDARVRSTYGPEKYARLVALKDRYDPGNLFRLNQNIRPSGAAVA